MDDEIVIVDDQGGEHIFPAGFDPKRAAAIVRQQAQPQADTANVPSPLNALGIQVVSDDAWSKLSMGEKARGLLQAGGKALGTAFGLGTDPVDNPGTTLASAVVPPLVGKAASGTGKALYRGGVALLPKTIKQANPGIVARGWAEGVPLTKRGAALAERLITGSRQQADDMILAAERAGAAPVPPMEVVRELRPVGQRMANQAAIGKPNAIPGLVDRARRLVQRGPVPLTQAQALKREAQDLAQTAYQAADRGATINTMDPLTDEAVARGLRKAIEARVPGVDAVNARTQELLGVLRGAEHASSTAHVLPRLVAGTGATAATGGLGAVPSMAAGLAAGTLATPGGMTAAGIGLQRVGAFSPAFLRYLMAGALQGQRDEPR